MSAKENTLGRAKGVTSKVRRIVKGCNFEIWNNIQPDKVQKFLADLRNNGKGISAQTYNWYLQAIKQFCKWMVQNNRANKSPVEHLTGLNVQTDRRHDRRALSVNEIHRLLDATEKAKTRFGMTGHQRALLYQLAIETGLRASELRSLTVSSFDFKKLMVTVEAAYSKHRRQDTLPLKPDTVTVLKEFFANKMSNTQDVPDKPVKMLKVDLEKTEIRDKNGKVIEKAIPYVDDAGLYADFHSLQRCSLWRNELCVNTGLIRGCDFGLNTAHNPEVAGSTVLLEAEKRFHRIRGYRELTLLVEAIQKVFDKQEVVA